MIASPKSPQFVELARTFDKAPDQIILFPCNGNWGDSLIVEGTLQFLKSIGKEWIWQHDINSLSQYNNPWGVIIGGGAWCKNWDYCRSNTRKVSPFCEKVIVFPSTFGLEFDEIKPPNIEAWRRDDFALNGDLPFCHDLAFFVKLPKFADPTINEGFFFRTDKESRGDHEIVKSNRDLSTEGHHGTDAYKFFEIVSRYKTVYTDRLHVAIAGARVGAEVHLFEGDYGKNQAVFNTSLQGGNVTFHNEPFCAFALQS